MVRALGLLSLVVGLCGCVRGARTYHDENMDFGSIATVAVMPFANLGRDANAAERVRDVFSNMLLATGAVYVLPPGEVARGVARAGVRMPSSPSAEDAIKLGGALKADALITGVLKEYGQVGTGTSTANAVSMSLQMIETTSGKLIWSASSTRGGVSVADRLLGSAGAPMNDVTEQAVHDLLDKLFK